MQHLILGDPHTFKPSQFLKDWPRNAFRVYPMRRAREDCISK
jgi:hypothetical protein